MPETKAALQRRIVELEAANAAATSDLARLVAMERVARAVRGATDMPQLLEGVLDELLGIFDCDRAWLLYPCDPDTPAWGVPMERSKPKWPGVFTLGVQVPMDEPASEVFREALEVGEPLPYDDTTERSLPPEIAAAFGIKSQMLVAMRPRNDVPWLLGIHHCENSHVYTAEEQLVFQALADRLADALDTLLLLRDLRATEAQIAQLARTEAIGTLAAGLAHDFNNKLLVILCSTELLQEELGSPSSYIDQVTGAAHKAARLTQELLAFSRRAVLDPRPVDLTEATHATAGLLRRALGPQMRLELPDLGRPVYGMVDPAQLEQVVVNLVINARDAIEQGGVITVETSVVEVAADDQAPRELSPGSYAVLTVRDTGVGMDPGMLKSIFEPFFTTKERGKGTGLGLSTAYGVARQSGGTLSATSVPGEGSVFSLWLPASDTGPTASSGAFDAVSPTQGDERVLLVDEDESVARVTKQVLRRRGYDVTWATSSEEALRLLQSGERFDLLLTEIALAGMDGVELGAEALRIRPELALTFSTGYSTGAIERIREAGASRRLLQKPYTPDELAQHVRGVLDRRSSSKQRS